MSSSPPKSRLLFFVIILLGLSLGAYVAYQWNAGTLPGQAGPSEGKGSAAPPQGNAAQKGPGGPGGPGGPVIVETARVEQIRLEDDLSAVGTLLATESVLLKSEVAGRIKRIAFADGQRVARDQILIEFDAAVQAAQVKQAQAERDLANAKLRRTEDLFAKNFLSAAARDDAQANQEIAEARLQLAQANLQKMILRAPFDAVIGIRQVSVGDYIKDGTDLIQLEDTRSMKVDFRVPEQAAGRLRVGQTVNLASDALPDRLFSARVSALDAAIDVSGRSLLIRAELRNPPPQLRPGMFVRVRLVLNEKPKALVIPEEAIVTAQGSKFVYKVVDSKAVRQVVQTGLRTLSQNKPVVEITQGLSAGDEVITAGQIKIRADQTPVKASAAPAQP